MFPLGVAAAAVTIAAARRAQRRRAQRKLAQQIRRGEYEPSPVGRKAREAARRLQPPPPLPPPPPEPPGGPGGGGGGRWTGPYRESWQDFTTERDIADIQERTGYSENEIFQAHYEIFGMLTVGNEDSGELQQMWEDYIMAFVSDDMTHDAFFEMWNIDPRDFDWEMWRDAMGYSRGK